MILSLLCIFFTFVDENYFLNTIREDDNFKYEPKVLGGKDTKITEAPYMVSILRNREILCGGCIINQRAVITAAHCTDSILKKNLSIRVRAGTADSDGTDGKMFEIAKIIQHEKYDKRTNDYDISILIMETNFEFSNIISPIKLPSYDIPIGTVAQVFGWGITERAKTSPLLQSVIIQTVSLKYCRKMLTPLTVTGRMLCAGEMKGGKDACSSDSGGPLVVNGELHGIVSWGISCAVPNYPSVYTRVFPFARWILNEI